MLKNSNEQCYKEKLIFLSLNYKNIFKTYQCPLVAGPGLLSFPKCSKVYYTTTPWLSTLPSACLPIGGSVAYSHRKTSARRNQNDRPAFPPGRGVCSASEAAVSDVTVTRSICSRESTPRTRTEPGGGGKVRKNDANNLLCSAFVRERDHRGDWFGTY